MKAPVQVRTGARSRSRLEQVLLFAALALLAPVVAGCGPDYERTDITAVKQSPLGGQVTYTRIDVPSGMIVTAHIVPWNDDNKTMDTNVRSRDPAIVEVVNLVSEQDYSFFGIRPGVTQVEVRADNKLVLVIDAVVSEQPALP